MFDTAFPNGTFPSESMPDLAFQQYGADFVFDSWADSRVFLSAETNGVLPVGFGVESNPTVVSTAPAFMVSSKTVDKAVAFVPMATAQGSPEKNQNVAVANSLDLAHEVGQGQGFKVTLDKRGVE
jgi:hypothetical protein